MALNDIPTNIARSESSIAQVEGAGNIGFRSGIIGLYLIQYCDSSLGDHSSATDDLLNMTRQILDSLQNSRVPEPITESKLIKKEMCCRVVTVFMVLE